MESETVTNEQLVRRVQSGADVSENMLQLWEQCRAFVAMLANKYQGAAEMDDLMQEGFLALCEAVDAYDPERGMTFISFSAFLHKAAHGFVLPVFGNCPHAAWRARHDPEIPEVRLRLPL